MHSRFSRQIVKDSQMNIIYIKTKASSQRHLRLLCYLHKEIEGTSANIFIAPLPSLPIRFSHHRCFFFHHRLSRSRMSFSLPSSVGL
jgi:hypothetical protein